MNQSPNQHQYMNGFALFVVIFLLAILSLISLAMVNAYLTNTRATSLEVQRIKVNQLFDSGLRFAALSLASPRAKVADSAVPSERLVYESPIANVEIEIRNEAGFIDLLSADIPLVESVLIAHGSSERDAADLIKSIRLIADKLDKHGKAITYRALRKTLNDTGIRTQELLMDTSLHNGQKGVHAGSASENVLALIPRLSKADRERFLDQRRRQREGHPQDLISHSVSSVFFTSTVSAHYRVNLLLELNGQRYSKVYVIKMINQRGQLFELLAIL